MLIFQALTPAILNQPKQFVFKSVAPKITAAVAISPGDLGRLGQRPGDPKHLANHPTVPKAVQGSTGQGKLLGKLGGKHAGTKNTTRVKVWLAI